MRRKMQRLNHLHLYLVSPSLSRFPLHPARHRMKPRWSTGPLFQHSILRTGLKTPAAGASTEWTCGTCMLNNPASATEKCTICDAPKAGVEPPKPAPSFNWGAAGMKPVTGPSNDGWTCSQCSLQNPVGATVKCTICDAPKPGAATEPLQPAPSFNWGAAGMKPMTGPADGEWSCSQCSLKNPSTATEKCMICDAPKPGATAAPAPKTTGFNWGAVGMKAPTSNGSAVEWTCGLCELKNPADAKAKCTICDAPRS
ncbi:hypothetical protein P691DRAFT_22528 [Macrolepiota fuliginosa MF-IS2]|uniref:RanBP2-type domain-containing protein n=1 Tax=Macrolepiota fuliginosa MF-IS2 TaxID=1400762 RepID=A0A9P6C941_9AGAR|nr:hypothetical protein P691DRAFT_22528 [Macrolepiota fuliginosa MF-IS2]